MSAEVVLAMGRPLAMGLPLATAARLTALAGRIYTNAVLRSGCLVPLRKAPASYIDRATVARSRPTKGHGAIWDHMEPACSTSS